MANVLFDALISPQVNRAQTFLDVPGGWPVSFGELEARTARVANALTSLGVQPGDRVAAQVAKCTDAIALYLGTVRAGAIFLPLNTAYTAPEVAYFLGDATPRVFACDPAAAAELTDIATDSGAQLLTLSGDGTGTLPELVDSQSGKFDTVGREEDAYSCALQTNLHGETHGFNVIREEERHLLVVLASVLIFFHGVWASFIPESD